MRIRIFIKDRYEIEIIDKLNRTNLDFKIVNTFDCDLVITDIKNLDNFILNSKVLIVDKNFTKNDILYCFKKNESDFLHLWVSDYFFEFFILDKLNLN